MGLQFTVGPPDTVFIAPYGAKVAALLSREYPEAVTRATPKSSWCSDEGPWSGWSALQSSVAKALGKPKPYHLGSVDAWCGGFLPVDIKPARMNVPGMDTPLKIASTVHLDAELRGYARKLRLPTAESQLVRLFDRCLDVEDRSKDDVLVYCQLMQAVQKSLERKQPLWVVK